VEANRDDSVGVAAEGTAFEEGARGRFKRDPPRLGFADVASPARQFLT
jgi:hypothetical protein